MFNHGSGSGRVAKQLKPRILNRTTVAGVENKNRTKRVVFSWLYSKRFIFLAYLRFGRAACANEESSITFIHTFLTGVGLNPKPTVFE